MSGQRGFTLLELIVVIGIFGLMSVMAYGGLDSVLRTRSEVEAAMARTAAFQNAYRRLRDDLQQLRLRPVRDGFGDVQPALDGVSAEGPVSFTRGGWRNPLQQPRPGLERVRYRLERERLLRDSWRVLDQAQDSPVVELVLLERIESLRWRYLDQAREWRDTWPPDTDQQPPLLVELVLQSRDWGEIRWLFRPGPDAAAGAFATPPVLGGDDPGGGTPPPTEPQTP